MYVCVVCGPKSILLSYGKGRVATSVWFRPYLLQRAEVRLQLCLQMRHGHSLRSKTFADLVNSRVRSHNLTVSCLQMRTFAALVSSRMRSHSLTAFCLQMRHGHNWRLKMFAALISSCMRLHSLTASAVSLETQTQPPQTVWFSNQYQHGISSPSNFSPQIETQTQPAQILSCNSSTGPTRRHTWRQDAISGSGRKFSDKNTFSSKLGVARPSVDVCWFKHHDRSEPEYVPRGYMLCVLNAFGASGMRAKTKLYLQRTVICISR